ncbi:serine/threonine-protein phosphatase 7 long form-like protein [Senna tora]|uniref:Serine/threonine-protein phosphatase 7 long form-like protein n=1 Tax=Senna tora TaxID=362788 RepID=A0A834W4I5_9FABA|nr:serine/threonine-protein phosphatase 7 long form-like protein [Senna tora]
MRATIRGQQGRQSVNGSDKEEQDDVYTIVWQPYKHQELPEYCLVGSNIWQAHVPLIYFHIIEWHQPDRVLRQFGMDQSIPDMPVECRLGLGAHTNIKEENICQLG